MKTKLNTYLITLLTSVLFLSEACTFNHEIELKHMLDKMENRYEEISIELGNAYWNLYTDKEVDLKTPKERFKKLLMNDTLNALVESGYLQIEKIQDTLLIKRIETWHKILLMAKVEYDDEIMLLRNELEYQMKVSNESFHDQDSLERMMIRLIKLRNRKAVDLGFENYAQLTFEVNGLGYEWFMEFVDELYTLTDNEYSNLVKKLKNKNGSEKFSYNDFYKLFRLFYDNQNPGEVIGNKISLVKETLQNIGIDYNELPSKLVEKQLPSGIGGQGLMINVPDDFRAVITLGRGAHIWMHEMGHGLQGLFCNINTPILEGYEWVPGSSATCFAEGMAETCAYFTRTKAWQLKYTAQNEEVLSGKKEIADENATAFIRYWLYRSMREIELYLNPDKPYKLIQEEQMN